MSRTLPAKPAPVPIHARSRTRGADLHATGRRDVAMSPAIVFGGLVLLALTLRLACTTGLIGSDDLRYGRYAQAIVDGTYGNLLEAARGVEFRHWGLRYGLLLPVAALYKFFGASEWTTILLPLVASTASVLLLADIGRRLFDLRVGVIAGLLYATFPIQLRYATVLTPEPIAELLVLIGVLCYVKARETARRASLLWFGAGLAFGVAYLAKEPALFVGGAVFLYAAWERRWRAAALLAFGITAIVAIEHTYYLFWQGDILFRPHATVVHRMLNPENAESELAYQLLRKYPAMMLLPSVDFGLHSLACLIGAAAALALKPRRNYLLVLFWTVIPWLYLNFGSASLQQYLVLPRAPRYIEFTYPPLMLLTGVVVSAALASRQMVARLMVGTLAAVLVVGVASGLATKGRGYRAEEMAVLREIVRRADAPQPQMIYTDQQRWRWALQILNRSLIASSPNSASIIVAPNALGLPSATRVAEVQREGGAK
jgi:hypothetical protein